MAVAAWIVAAAGFGLAKSLRVGADRVLDDSERSNRLGELVERRQMALWLIASTKFDLETGRIEKVDHDSTVNRLERQAVALSKQLAELQGEDVDRAAAQAAIDARLAASGGTPGDSDQRWSALAHARHQGRLPEAGGAA
jgi:hypothetical protein